MSQPEITNEVLDRFKQLPVATIYGGVRALGYEPCFMEGVQSFTQKAGGPRQDPAFHPSPARHRQRDPPGRGLA